MRVKEGAERGVERAEEKNWRGIRGKSREGENETEGKGKGKRKERYEFFESE